MVIAVLPEIVAALALLLLAFAAVQLVRPIIVGVLSKLPLIGGWVSTQVSILLLSVTIVGAGSIDAGINAITSLITSVFNDVWGHRVWTGYALEHAWAALDRVVNALLPLKLAEQAAYTTMVWVSVSAHTDWVWAQEAAHTDYVWAQVAAHTDYVWAQATDYTTRVWKLDSAHADYVWAQATAYATRIVADEAAHVDYVWGVTTRYAETLMGQEMQRAMDAERSILAAMAAATAGAIATTENLWGTETARARGAEAGIAAAATAAVAAVAARVTSIEDSPCQRYCGPLGDLGALLDGLSAVVLPAAMIALIEECMTHPADVAAAIDANVAKPAQQLAAAFQLGIPA